MQRDQLLRLLDLSGEETGPGEPAAFSLTTDEVESQGPASPTALELDSWALRQGQELLDESQRLQTLGLDSFAVADFHGCAFLPDPVLLPCCADPVRHAFLGQLLETGEYRALHATTQLCHEAAAIAACAFAEQFARLARETAATNPDAKEMATLRAVGRALDDASEEVTRMRETCRALGLGPGEPGSNDARAIAELYRRVRGNPTLRRICDLAGRFRRVAQSRQRRKVLHGLDDLVGVVQGGDPARLLPVELAKLAIPELELDTLRRLVERQCMAREFRAIEPLGKGPLVVSVDESGSMAGERVHTAKALALALAWLARRQRRWCALVAYSGESGERLLALPPGRWDESKLADWLCSFLGRGSSLDVPVREMPRYYRQLGAPAGKTDVVFVTDAACCIPDEVRESFLGWKRQTCVRVISLVLQNDPCDLAAISDECHRVGKISAGEEAVGRILSV